MESSLPKYILALMTCLSIGGIQAQSQASLDAALLAENQVSQINLEDPTENLIESHQTARIGGQFTEIGDEAVLTKREMSSNIPKGFYLITGRFLHKKDARDQRSAIRNKGFNGEILSDRISGNYFVYVAFHEGLSDAQQEYAKLTEDSELVESLELLEVVHELNAPDPERSEDIFSDKSTLSPSNLIQKADGYFKNMRYAEAAQFYEQAYSELDDPQNYEIIKKLADSYYFNTDMPAALKWYSLLYERNEGSLSPENLFKYSQSLKGNNKYRKARRIMNLYEEKVSGSQEDLSNNSNQDPENTIESILEIEQDITLVNLEINTPFSEFSPMFYNEGEIVFASDMTTDTGLSANQWNDQPLLDLYSSKGEVETNQFEQASKLPSSINTGFPEASAVFTKDGQKVFFTRNVPRKRLGKQAYDINHLKIFYSENRNGVWSEAQELALNSENYSIAHPALSPDEKQLYFVSDMPGTIGKTDIFVVDILEGGQFSQPRNLGPDVNTPMREVFPFLTGDQLYFSSDGHAGFGGLDIFKTMRIETGIGEVQNLGRPFNSSQDDFSFILDEESKVGFLASNREGGKGGDDIYAFQGEPSLELDSDSLDLAADSLQIAANSLDTNLTEQGIDPVFSENSTSSVSTNSSGSSTSAESSISIEQEADQTIPVTSTVIDQYIEESIASHTEAEAIAKQEDHTLVETQNESSTSALDSEAKPVDLPGETQMTEALDDIMLVENGVKKLRTGDIYFDFDKYHIRQDAAKELDKLVSIMKQHQGMIIGIESHTDSRGNREYNRKLSDRRAKATRDYLISNGISPERIQSAIGYGEDRLLNACDESVKCSREMHQSNRRSEFVVVKM